MPRYRVRSLAPRSLVGPGALAGALVALPPGVALGILVTRAVGGIHHTLDTWRAARLPLPAPLPAATVDVVDLLRLTPLLAAVRAWDASPPLVFAGLTVVTLVLGATAGALAALLTALLFNAGAALGRGLVLDLEPLPDDD